MQPTDDVRDNEGWTGLMRAAAWNQKPAATQVLLDPGVNK